MGVIRIWVGVYLFTAMDVHVYGYRLVDFRYTAPIPKVPQSDSIGMVGMVGIGIGIVGIRWHR